MLRLILKLIAAVLALALLVIGGLSVALPRLVNTDEFRTALHESAAGALGSSVEWASLDAGVVPLRLTIIDPVFVAEGTNREDARLTADSIDLRLSAVALLQKKVQLDSLVLSGVEFVVTRTAEGMILPIAPQIDPPSPPSPQTMDDLEAPDSSKGSAGGGFALELHRLVLEDSRIVIRDRTLPRSIEWTLSEVSLEATGEDLAGPLALAVSSRVAANGREIGGLDLNGEVALSGFYDLDLVLDRLRLEEFQPYISDLTMAGAASGRVSVEGADGAISEMETDLLIDEMIVRTLGLDLVGRLALVANQSSDAPMSFDAKLDLGDAGKADIDGTMTLDGDFDAVIMLDELDIAPYAQLAGDALSVGGHATGRLEVAATLEGGLERLSTDLDIPDARYVDDALELAGALDLIVAINGLGQNDPVQFDIVMDLAEGGGLIDAKGNATLAGAVESKLVLGNVDLAKVTPWVPVGTRIVGRLSGAADLSMNAARVIERVKANIAIADGRFVSDSVDVAGKFELDVDLGDQGPIELLAALQLEDGSGLRAVGNSTPEGVVDVNATLTTFDLDLIRPFLPDPEMELSGLASGKGRLVGAVTAPEFMSLDLGIENGAFKSSEYSVEGPFLAVIEVKEPLSRPRGRIELDLTAASLRYLDQFTKKAGMRAEMTTRFVPEESGEIVFESKLKLRNIDEILIQGSIGATNAVTVTTTNFNLKGWSEVFPVLAKYDADGVLSVEGLGVEWADGSPSQLGGRVLFRGVGLTVADAGRVRLRGMILGEETRIRTKGLKALVGGATIGIKGAIEDPLGEGVFDFSIKSLGKTETNDVLSALTTMSDTIFGPLAFSGRVEGRLDHPNGVTESLDGNFHFSVGEGGGGRLRGISLLRTILDQIPILRGTARLTQPFLGGKSVDDYFTERFEMIEGNFKIGEGKVVAEMLRLAYPGYEARLRGPMQLRDLGIDMTGELLIKGDLLLTLGGMAGVHMPDREPIRIQLARVTNTLTDPKVVMTKETLAVVPKLLLQATGLDTLTLGIGKTLGKGVGKALGQVLGGGK